MAVNLEPDPGHVGDSVQHRRLDQNLRKSAISLERLPPSTGTDNAADNKDGAEYVRKDSCRQEYELQIGDLVGFPDAV